MSFFNEIFNGIENTETNGLTQATQTGDTQLTTLFKMLDEVLKSKQGGGAVYKDPETEAKIKDAAISDVLWKIIEAMANKHKPLNKSQKRIFRAAIMGMTKAGKTAIIAALLKYPELFLELCRGFDDRTKVIVETHFVEGTEGIEVENIVWNEGALKNTASPSAVRIKRYNERLTGEVGNVLKDLGFKELDEKADPAVLNAHVDEVIKSLNGQPMNPELIKKLINTEGIDKYVKRVVLQVAPSDEFAEVLREKNIDLYIRDTRGLFDIEVKGNTITNIPTYSDLGVEDLDAVIFVATSPMPNVTLEIYNDLLSNILRSVPVFMVARNPGMIGELYDLSYHKPITKNIVELYLEQLHNGTYNSNSFFRAAYTLMSKAGIVSRDKATGQWEFCDTFFDRKQVEYLVPDVEELGVLGEDPDYPTLAAASSPNFKIYQMVCIQMFSKIIDDVQDLYEKMSQIRIPAAIEFLKTYLEMSKNGGLTFYMTPGLTYYDSGDLVNDILNPDCQLLGERNGITTMNNGKLRYPAAAVMAVTSCGDLRRVIAHTTISQEMYDLLPGATEDALSKLLSKTLLNTRYHFIDPDACVQQYFISNRYVVRESILNERNAHHLSREGVIDSVIETIIRTFVTFILLDKDPEIDRLS